MLIASFRTVVAAGFLVAGSIVLASGVACASPSVYPTGVTIYDPALAYNSYVAYATYDNRSLLIDMNGTIVHTWPYSDIRSKCLIRS